jgi:hypothetical protein
MSDKTTLVMPGQKLAVPKLAKRVIQVGISVGLTCAVALLLILGNGMLLGRTSTARGINRWLAFIQQPEIQGTMFLTAIVTVLFVYWQRDKERR